MNNVQKAILSKKEKKNSIPQNLEMNICHDDKCNKICMVESSMISYTTLEKF
jgi:hypothetical protein